MPKTSDSDIVSVLCSDPMDLDASLVVIKQVVTKEFNSRETVITLLQSKGDYILRNLLNCKGVQELEQEQWDLIVLLAILIVKYSSVSMLCYLIQLLPDKAVKADIDTDNGRRYVVHMARLMEIYVRKLISDSITRFPFTSDGDSAGGEISWKDELAYVRPVVILLLTAITNRQGVYVNSTEIEPFQERDDCSEYVSMLSLLLLFEAGKRTFVEVDGFTTLMMVSAQTQSITVVTSILAAFHSCVFNVVDSVNEELDGPPSSTNEDAGRRTTIYNIVVDAFAFVRPYELINSTYERFYRLAYTPKPKKPLFSEDQIKQQLDGLTFSIVLLFHDCVLPETAGFANQDNLLFVADYISSIAQDVNPAKPVLLQSDGSLAAFNTKIKGGIEAIMRLISLHTETPTAVRVLIDGESIDTDPVEDEKHPNVKAGDDVSVEVIVPKNLNFLRSILNAIAVTDCSTLAGTLLSFMSLIASCACCSNQRLAIPLDFLYYERLLRWISAYGSHILGGHPDNTKTLQNLEDACLVLICLVEGSEAEVDADTMKDSIAKPTALTRDEIWSRLALKPESHGILMLAMAMSVIKGLVPTLTGLLSVISCLMGTSGYFIKVLDVFRDKKEELCNFLVSLCADLSKQGAFCYVVCNSILKGMSSIPEVFSLVDVNELADALLPLGFSDDEDGILLKIVGSYKEVPPALKESCKKIMSIMDAIDADDVNTLGVEH